MPNFKLWWEQFSGSLKVPSGLDYADPLFIADEVNRFLICLQLMNKDAYAAGMKDATEIAERKEVDA